MSRSTALPSPPLAAIFTATGSGDRLVGGSLRIDLSTGVTGGQAEYGGVYTSQSLDIYPNTYDTSALVRFSSAPDSYSSAPSSSYVLFGKQQLGSTQYNWAGLGSVLQGNAFGAFAFGNSGTAGPYITSNCYWNGSNWKRMQSGSAGHAEFLKNIFVYYHTPAGNPDSNITWTAPFEIFSSGRVVIGETQNGVESGSGALQVLLSGTVATVTGAVTTAGVIGAYSNGDGVIFTHNTSTGIQMVMGSTGISAVLGAASNTPVSFLVNNSTYATLGTNGFIVQQANAGNEMQSSTYNTSNTSGSNAYFKATVGGTSAGDAYSQYTVADSTDWIAGVSNAISGRPYCIAKQVSFPATAGNGLLFEAQGTGEMRFYPLINGKGLSLYTQANSSVDVPANATWIRSNTGSIFIHPDNINTVGSKAILGYRSGQYLDLSAVEVSNVVSGYGTLNLMKAGGIINVGSASGSRFCTSKGTVTLSSGDLTLNADGNYFVVSGSVNAIMSSSWQAGSSFILDVASGSILYNNITGSAGTSKMLFMGGFNFSPAGVNGGLVIMAYDGTTFKEAGRSVFA